MLLENHYWISNTKEYKHMHVQTITGFMVDYYEIAGKQNLREVTWWRFFIYKFIGI